MITLQKKSFGTALIFAELIYVLFFNILRDYLGLPSAISYGIDILNLLVCCFLLIYGDSANTLRRLRLRGVVAAAGLLAFAAWLTALLNLVPPQLVLWSSRNSLRFLPFFFALIVFWEEDTADRLVRLLLRLQIPNLIIGCIEFFFLHKERDNVGGIFGTAIGCNGYLFAYLCIVTILMVEQYLHNNASFFLMGASCFASMLLSAMAELKVSYVVIPLIVIGAFLVNRPTLRAFSLALVFSAGLILSIYLLLLFFPSWSDSFSSVKVFLGMGRAAGGGYNISRLGAFSEINQLWFRNSLFKNIFGLGFGNCEYSSFSALTSDFYLKYGSYHYCWFSHQMWFLQTGYLGITCYGIFLLSEFFWIARMKRRFGDKDGVGSFGQILCGVILVNFVYNSSLITEIGYLLYAALALPFVYYKKYLPEIQRRESSRTFNPTPTESRNIRSDTVAEADNISWKL